MAGSPNWKVYRDKEYVASFKYVEDAAAMVAIFGEGSTIRDGHSLVVWREGKESFSAAESYDGVAQLAAKRRIEAAKAYFVKSGRPIPHWLETA